jgi:hypothetical protein
LLRLVNWSWAPLLRLLLPTRLQGPFSHCYTSPASR